MIEGQLGSWPRERESEAFFRGQPVYKFTVSRGKASTARRVLYSGDDVRERGDEEREREARGDVCSMQKGAEHDLRDLRERESGQLDLSGPRLSGCTA